MHQRRADELSAAITAHLEQRAKKTAAPPTPATGEGDHLRGLLKPGAAPKAEPPKPAATANPVATPASAPKPAAATASTGTAAPAKTHADIAMANYRAAKAASDKAKAKAAPKTLEDHSKKHGFGFTKLFGGGHLAWVPTAKYRKIKSKLPKHTAKRFKGSKHVRVHTTGPPPAVSESTMSLLSRISDFLGESLNLFKSGWDSPHPPKTLPEHGKADAFAITRHWPELRSVTFRGGGAGAKRVGPHVGSVPSVHSSCTQLHESR